MRFPAIQKRNLTTFSGDPDDFRLSLVEHLEELRDRVIRVILAVTLGSIVGWMIFPTIYAYVNTIADRALISALPKGTKYQEVFHNFSDAFMLQFRMAVTIGVSLAFPVVILQLWGFVAPALHPREQKPFRKLAPYSVALFVMGAGFCWLIIPAALKYFADYFINWKDVALMQDAGTMVFFILKMMLAFGIAFQLPLIVYGMGLAGILQAETLVKYWRQSATAVFLLAALITPSNDAFSMLAMAIPMTILFAISVWAVKKAQDKKGPDEDLSPYAPVE